MTARAPHWIRWDGANSTITAVPPPDDGAWGGYGYGQYDSLGAARQALLDHARAERDAWRQLVSYAQRVTARQVAAADTDPARQLLGPRRHVEILHICEVCHQRSEDHDERCHDDRHEDPTGRLPTEMWHWPPLCCPGCPCGSYEEAHDDDASHTKGDA